MSLLTVLLFGLSGLLSLSWYTAFSSSRGKTRSPAAVGGSAARGVRGESRVYLRGDEAQGEPGHVLLLMVVGAGVVRAELKTKVRKRARACVCVFGGVRCCCGRVERLQQ